MEITIIDKQIKEFYENNDLISFVHSIVRGMKHSGWLLAEALYLLKHSIILEEGESFTTWAALEFDLTSVTIDRYINLWNLVLNAPKKQQDGLLEKKINAVVPLGTNVANGNIELDEIDWERVQSIDTNTQMREMVREIRDIPEREGAITFQVKENGDIVVWQRDNPHFVGFLEVNSDDETVQKAVTRIKHYLKGQ